MKREACVRCGVLFPNVVLVLCIQPFIGAAKADLFGSGTNEFEIEFVPIGQPGNPLDTTGNPNPAGSVPYSYRIGKYEISEQMIDKANALGGLGITKDTRGPNKPATSVSWFEAAKFVNWLNTSAGHAPAYKFDDLGDFQLWLPSDPGYDPNNLFRNNLAKYFLPSAHEWYKAAYYDPKSGDYFNYPTGSNSVPDGIDFVGDTEFDAVFDNGLRTLEPNDVDNVGLLSPYGTAGQGGNAWEFEETMFDVLNNSSSILFGRGFRGGSWNSGANTLSRWDRSPLSPSGETGKAGFRVASVIPEPGACVLLGTGLLTLLGLRRCHSIKRSHCHAQHNC